jgi:hypothetical protein
MTPTKNQMATSFPEITGVTSFSDALGRLGKLTDDLGASIHRVINVARPHLVMDPRDTDDASVLEGPTPLASPSCHGIRAVNDRLEAFVELLNNFGRNFDT